MSPKPQVLKFKPSIAYDSMSKLSTAISQGEYEGVIINNEDLDDEYLPSREELQFMDDNNAAMLAGHLFERLTGVSVVNQHCFAFDQDEQTWKGYVNEYTWEIEKDGDDYLISILQSNEED